MKLRYANKKMMYAAFAAILLKVILTFGYFFYQRTVAGTFPSVLYMYLFILSLFPNGLENVTSLFAYLFVGASIPAILACVVLRHNRKYADYGAFIIALLSVGDILLMVTKGWLADDPIFVSGGIVLNLMICLFLLLMHRSGAPGETEE